MARLLDESRDVPRARLQRNVEFERKKREEAEQVAEAAEERATHAQTLKNKALADKRAATKLAAKLLKKADRSVERSKCAQSKLPEAVRERVDAAQADVVAAEIEKEKPRSVSRSWKRP